MEISDSFLKGKSTIINTLALSGFWYTGSVVPLPVWAEKKINYYNIKSLISCGLEKK